MRIIVCVDDTYGMLFNRRRQSKDSLLRADMLGITENSKLWMNAYSASQFEEQTDNICVDEDFLHKAEQDDYCFVENADIAPYAESILCVIVYRWNRSYPSDQKFPAELFETRWQLESTVDFAGSSHETITREVYVL